LPLAKILTQVGWQYVGTFFLGLHFEIRLGLVKKNEENVFFYRQGGATQKLIKNRPMNLSRAPNVCIFIKKAQTIS
jgi:hypothetical protein